MMELIRSSPAIEQTDEVYKAGIVDIIDSVKGNLMIAKHLVKSTRAREEPDPNDLVAAEILLNNAYAELAVVRDMTKDARRKIKSTLLTKKLEENGWQYFDINSIDIED
jgi:hypothetical protein